MQLIDRTVLGKEESKSYANHTHSAPLEAGARIYHSANQAISNNTATALSFDSERWDKGNLHSTSSNTSRLTITVSPGKYLIGAGVQFASSTTGRRQLAIRLNGSTLIAVTEYDTNQNAETNLSISTIYDLDIGDYVEVRVLQTSGGNLNVVSGANFSPEFMIQRIAS